MVEVRDVEEGILETNPFFFSKFFFLKYFHWNYSDFIGHVIYTDKQENRPLLHYIKDCDVIKEKNIFQPISPIIRYHIYYSILDSQHTDTPDDPD